MNADNLKKMYGSTPESFRQCVEQTLAQSPDHAPHRAPVRRALRLALVCALILALLTAAAYAVFSPRVAEVFGAAYGPAAQERLQAGRSAQPESSIDLDGVRYTLHEVTYIDSGLYAVATIRPADGAKIVLLPQEEDDPDTPVGTDRYNAIHPGPDAPTYGEKAAETGAKLVAFSSDQVYAGVEQSGPLPENIPLQPGAFPRLLRRVQPPAGGRQRPLHAGNRRGHGRYRRRKLHAAPVGLPLGIRPAG